MIVILDNHIPAMFEIFHGLEEAHGVFVPEKQDGKKQIGRASTTRQPVSYEDWRRHLEGSVGLGIIPINKDSCCRWGVIDIDNYDLDWEELLGKIKDTPLVCCQSKSGGAHLFIFCKEFIPAKHIRDYLRNMVGILGLGNSEVFPKQDRVHSERGDIGNWLNMPYFGDSRFCFRDWLELGHRATPLSLSDFIRFVQSKMVEKDYFLEPKKLIMKPPLSREDHLVCKSCPLTASLNTLEIGPCSILEFMLRRQCQMSGSRLCESLIRPYLQQAEVN